MPRRNDISTKAAITMRILVCIAVFIAVSVHASANVCVHRTLHLSRVQGVVTDEIGVPIPGATVSLSRQGSAAIEITTDANGRFLFKGISGNYDFRVRARGFADVWFPVDVGFNVRNVFHSNLLYVISSVASDSDYCPQPITSERKYQKTISDYTKHLKEVEQTNATQK